ncbi:MAG: CRISPR system precrRNA processing endoribonuclease RAMP protein Cas6 [Desulfobacterales bacterium]|nr:CRISPR system precrRNA processing endoribonuclease RAMP protein Cas6 [Desulfobacterales bacterium]
MLFRTCEFHCRFTTPALLPEFKGSMLRGAFGHALKRVACTLGRQRCDDCLLAPACGYAFIFEAARALPGNGNDRPRNSGPPLPFVLNPPQEPDRDYKPGDPLEFSLTLFGRANDFLPHIIYAVEQMGESGLGKKTRAGQGCFQLLAISSGATTIYDGERKILKQQPPLERLSLGASPAEPARAVSVHLLTPLRLKYHNRFQDTLPFHVLIRAALRRISTLAEIYGDGEPQLDYQGIIKRAQGIEIKENKCRWIDLTRYSNRQKTAMRIGGIKGMVSYQGDLAEFLPLLQFCEKSHLGKQTAFGLGRIELTVDGGTAG